MTTMAAALGIVFIVASMAGVGLRVSVRELQGTLRERGFLVRALVANFVVIPVVGIALARMVPTAQASEAAIVMLACAAGGTSALQFTSKQRSALAHSGATAFTLTFIAVFVSPILIRLTLPEGTPLAASYVRPLSVVLLLLGLPLALGMALRKPAGWLASPVTWLGTLAFFGFVAVTLTQRRAAIATLETQAVAAMLALIVVCMAIGWLMGGPGRPNRRVLATASSMRNVALCLAIVPDASIHVPLVAFSALMIPPNLLFFLATRWRDRRAQA